MVSRNDVEKDKMAEYTLSDIPIIIEIDHGNLTRIF